MMIDYSSHDGIATLTLGDEAAHAISEATIDALCVALAVYASDDSAQVAVLTGAGDSFPKGAALQTLGNLFNSDAARLVCDALDALSKPVVAAMRGPVSGAALEIALACDWRIADGSASFGFPEFAIGLPPAAGATQRLPALIGVDAALDLMLGGGPVAGARAHALGLVDALLGVEWAVEVARFAANIATTASTRRPGSQLNATDIAAGLDTVARRRADLAAVRCDEGVAVCDAVATGLSEGFDAGYAVELDGYLQCENSPRQRAVSNVRQMRSQVESRGLAGPGEQRAPLRRVIVLGAAPASPSMPRAPRVLHVADDASLPVDLDGEDIVVMAGSPGVSRLDALATRWPSTTMLVVESAHSSMDADARAALPPNVVLAITYGRDAARILQIVGREAMAMWGGYRAVEVGALLGWLCIHASPVPLGPAALLGFDDAVRALADGGVDESQLRVALDARGLPAVYAVASKRPPSSQASADVTPLTAEAIETALMCALLNASAGLLDTRDAAHPDDLDTLFYYGYDVPPESLPFGWGSTVHGVARVYEDLVKLEAQYGAAFRPTELLERIGVRAPG